MERRLADRAAINQLWKKMLALRVKIAANAGLPDFRAYTWQRLLRFDYTPDDCAKFHDAIEQVVVPAASRLYEHRRKMLGLDTLRPWDLEVDPLTRPPLKPYQTVEELERKTGWVFEQVDPVLGGYFKTMVSEGLLDLENRKNKAPGAYSNEYNVIHRPFIFHNAVGIHMDVQTLFHEGGHAFHSFEYAKLPYLRQKAVPNEFAEVASMAMELLATPYLDGKNGFYSVSDAARARIEHLESLITFWPYMAVVDGFQHWVYENPQKAVKPAACDIAWAKLWKRFMPGVDWSGLEQELITGWQRKEHIHQVPFYYIEYGLAQLGAVQIWRNSLTDQAAAVASYRHALSLGYTVSLPELFRVAGARLVFDSDALSQAVDFMEGTIEKLQGTV